MNKNKANEMSKQMNIGQQETFMKKEWDMNNHAEWLRREMLCQEMWSDLIQTKIIELPDDIPERPDLVYANDGWQGWQYIFRRLLGLEKAKDETFGAIIDAMHRSRIAAMKEHCLIDRSTLAYHRRCVRNGLIFNQPNAGLSKVDGDIIVLRNCNGVLARYRITDKGLRFVEDSGAEDQTNE